MKSYFSQPETSSGAKCDHHSGEGGGDDSDDSLQAFVRRDAYSESIVSLVGMDELQDSRSEDDWHIALSLQVHPLASCGSASLD